MKIKEKILGLKDFIKKVFEKYPVTMIIIFLYTIFYSFILDLNLISNEWIEKISLFGVIWIFGVFFIENFDKIDKITKIVGKVVAALISFIFVWLLTNKNFQYDIIGKLCICYITTLCAFSLFFIIKKLDKNIPEYLLKVSINFTKVTFVYGILSLGVLFVYEIFNFLILDSKGEFLDNLEIILLGFYYLPKMIYALVDIKEEVNAFFKGVVKWVLMSIVIIAFAIIYIYIGKIIILRNIPKNQIFRILASLFIIGTPIWTYAQYFKDESFIYKVSLKLPLAFIPFIFLQMYTIGIRILSNGVTPLRYVCVALILFEIIYELFFIIKKEKIQYLILVLDAMVIISLIVPVINMYDFSDFSQSKILKLFKENTTLSDEEKDKIYGAYSYLLKSDNGEKYIDSILTKEDKDTIKEFSLEKSEYYYNNYENFYFDNNDSVEISGYNTLTMVENNSYNSYDSFNSYNRDDTDGLVFNSVDFKHNSETIVNVDCSKFIERFLNEYKKNGKDMALEYLEDNNEIKVDNNSKIVITHLSLRYNTKKDTVASFSCEGFYLEK